MLYKCLYFTDKLQTAEGNIDKLKGLEGLDVLSDNLFRENLQSIRQGSFNR